MKYFVPNFADERKVYEPSNYSTKKDELSLLDTNHYKLKRK